MQWFPLWPRGRDLNFKFGPRFAHHLHDRHPPHEKTQSTFNRFKLADTNSGSTSKCINKQPLSKSEAMPRSFSPRWCANLGPNLKLRSLPLGQRGNHCIHILASAQTPAMGQTQQMGNPNLLLFHRLLVLTKRMVLPCRCYRRCSRMLLDHRCQTRHLAVPPPSRQMRRIMFLQWPAERKVKKQGKINPIRKLIRTPVPKIWTKIWVPLKMILLMRCK